MSVPLAFVLQRNVITVNGIWLISIYISRLQTSRDHIMFVSPESWNDWFVMKNLTKKRRKKKSANYMNHQRRYDILSITKVTGD
jgi:hypothetical protein